jgi:hypothetical protein
MARTTSVIYDANNRRSCGAPTIDARAERQQPTLVRSANNRRSCGAPTTDARAERQQSPSLALASLTCARFASLPCARVASLRLCGAPTTSFSCAPSVTARPPLTLCAPASLARSHQVLLRGAHLHARLRVPVPVHHAGVQHVLLHAHVRGGRQDDGAEGEREPKLRERMCSAALSTKSWSSRAPRGAASCCCAMRSGAQSPRSCPPALTPLLPFFARARRTTTTTPTATS